MKLESLQPEIEKLEDLSTYHTLYLSHTNDVGGYRIGRSAQHCIQFNLTKKPSFIHRLFTKLLLGWIWVDNKN